MLTNVEIIAIAKAISEKSAQYGNARAELGVGEHQIAVTVTVEGGLKVGADYEQVCAPEADPWGLLAVALSKLNAVTVASIVEEHLNADENTIKEIKAQAKAALAAIKEPTRKSCKGKVTTSLTVNKVEVAV